jgi:hypothetical protein
MARSWSEIVHDVIYHPSGRPDPAFEAHLYREESIRLGREQLELMEMQTSVLERSLEQMQTQFSEVVSSLDYGFSELRDAIALGFELSTKATTSAIARSAWLTQQAIAESRDAIMRGFRDLQAAFTFGLTQIVWQQEQTNKLLTDILSVLKAPRKTEADEMRERGDEAYRNAINARRPEDRQQWMNVALQAYADCVDKNPSDFSALYSIGMVLFYERGISEDALTAFRMAATFAEPYSSYHAALAWLQIGYIRRCRKEMEQSYEAMEEAVRLQPDWAETHFQRAISCALTDRLDEMKESLKRAIRLDRNYWFRACTEPDLMAGHGVVRETVRIALEELRQEASQEASKAIASAQARIAELNRLIQGVTDLNLPASSGVWHKEQAEKSLDEARQLKAQETYFELLDAKAKAEEAQQICGQGITSLSEEAHNAVDNREKALNAELLARRQEYETELKALEDSTSHALLQAERSSQTELSNQKYALESEKRRLLDEAKKKVDYWQKGLINEITLTFIFGFIGIGVGSIIATLTLSFTASLIAFLVITFSPFVFFRMMEKFAKTVKNRIEREYNDRIAALERKWSEELNLRRQQIIQQAEEERQALKERFERQCAELERLMDQEVIQKRHLLAQLFKT